MHQFIDIPSCVPSVPGLEEAGASFDASVIDRLAKLPRVIGLAEVMDFLGVVDGEDRMMEIIDAADVGRTTFYAHFGTKDDLLKALCEELFGHILSSALDHTHGSYADAPVSVFCHLLQHLQEDEHHILELLSCESSELFLRYFKDSLNVLIRNQLITEDGKGSHIPQDFLVNHISSSFVEMVLWWIKGQMKQTPEELDRYFRAVIEPILSLPDQT